MEDDNEEGTLPITDGEPVMKTVTSEPDEAEVVVTESVVEVVSGVVWPGYGESALRASGKESLLQGVLCEWQRE